MAMWIETRSLLSRKSNERQTSQLQPITGTPCDVPDPRTVIFTVLGWFEITPLIDLSSFHLARPGQFLLT